MYLNVQMLSQAVTKYCMEYFGNSSKNRICILEQIIFKIADVESLKSLFYYHYLDFMYNNTGTF